MKRSLFFYPIIMMALFSTLISGLFYRAQATTESIVTGSGWAAPILTDSGDFACSTDPGPVGSVSYELHFAATYLPNKTLSGIWYISVFEETGGHILGGEQHGTLNGGTIASASFNLTGEITFDNLCLSPIPTIVSITGKCGPLASRSPNVEFRTASGETGSFFSDTFCSP